MPGLSRHDAVHHEQVRKIRHRCSAMPVSMHDLPPISGAILAVFRANRGFEMTPDQVSCQS